MKKTFLLLSFTLLILRGITPQAVAQNFTYNPYESLGKIAPVLTLSEGRYQEFMTNDTVVQIGSVLFNTLTNEVVSFLEEDSLRLVDADLMTRFLSVDPIGRKFPELTPYQFASNTPICAIDLDGLEAYLFINNDQIESIKQFQSGKNMNVIWQPIKMVTFDDVANYLNHEYEMSCKPAKVVYITMHGDPGQIYTDPGPNGVIETAPCRSATDCPPFDDKSFGGAYQIDNYIAYRKTHATGFDKESESMSRIDKLKRVMNEIENGGTLILGGCHIGSGTQGDETLEALNRLSGGRINIVANTDYTNETTNSKDADGKSKSMFLDAGRTSNGDFEGGWKIIGPNTNNEVKSTSKNLKLNAQNTDLWYEFVEEK